MSELIKKFEAELTAKDEQHKAELEAKDRQYQRIRDENSKLKSTMKSVLDNADEELNRQIQELKEEVQAHKAEIAKEKD